MNRLVTVWACVVLGLATVALLLVIVPLGASQWREWQTDRALERMRKCKAGDPEWHWVWTPNADGSQTGTCQRR